MDGILLINKPAGMTSHDVVNYIRRLLHTKKVGHCGTLDPDATGVLVLCIGKATKALQFLTSEEKEYIATLSLGKSTDTYDASGTVLETKEFQGADHVEEVLLSFLGAQKQMPPIYSAIKVNGKKLYEYARNGEDVHIENAQQILITQNKKYLRTETSPNCKVIYVPGKFDSINFNYQIMTICDLIRLHYFQQYYL